MAMGLVHGLSAIRVLSPSVLKYLCGVRPCEIEVSLDEVPDQQVREVVRP